MKRPLVVACLSPLLLAACGGAPAVGERAQPIVNGTTDDTDTAVVMVLAQVPGSQTGSLCTAEIISPHVVLTAAHCVDPATVGSGAKFIVFTGTTLTSTSPRNEFLSVMETHFDTTFDSTDPTKGHDVGVVILSAAAGITPIPYNRAPLPQSMVGQMARLVGYGITSASDTTGTTAGTRRQAPTMVQSFDNLLINLEDMQHTICEGDSGGPALLTIDGSEKIVGITSYGFQGCPLNQPGTDTRIDSYAGFIDPYVEQFDPPAVNAGDTCNSDADCYPRSCQQTSVGKICVQSCDPNNSAICPMGTQCSSVDGNTICAKPTGNGAHSGCALAAGAPSAGFVLWALVACVAALGRRRLRS